MDAMGGDFAPGAVVAGAVESLKSLGEGHRIVLVGRAADIRRELGYLEWAGEGLEIVHTDGVVGMHEAATAVIREKRDSSITEAIRLHREGRVDAVISAGNTGAAMVASLTKLGRIPGVHRPVIGAFIPSERGPVLLLDVGANPRVKPCNLVQFGAMGSIYVSHILERKDPRVALLNIGQESSKGDDLITQAHRLFEKSPLNFVGNVEGTDILAGGADVMVCDGFVGNILLKFAESIPRLINRKFREDVKKSPFARVGSLLMKSTFHRVKKRFDYEEYGGVPLLGIRGITVICHGSSTPLAIKNAIMMTLRVIGEKINDHIREQLSRPEYQFA